MATLPSGRTLALALGAYLCWGLLPLYPKLLAAMPPVQVLAHRALWSAAARADRRRMAPRRRDPRLSTRADAGLARHLGDADLRQLIRLHLRNHERPLMFAAAARRRPYSTLGLSQYIAPTLQFLEAVLLFGEPLRGYHIVMFALIWSGCALFAWDTVPNGEQARVSQPAAGSDPPAQPRYPGLDPPFIVVSGPVRMARQDHITQLSASYEARP